VTQQIINVGAAINDGTGDPARTAYTKCNDNFTELYPRDVPQCGRLTFVSATQLKFSPLNGDRIKIAGTVYAIPSAGIAALTNGGLSASTLYYVYAFNSSGTITGEISTTTHATSSTVGNVGVETKSGDDTRTLIGMCRTNASSQFQSDAQNRFVISWFNRRAISLQGTSTAGAATGSLTLVSIVGVASNALSLISWAEEAVVAGLQGFMYNNAVNGVSYATIGLDSTTVGIFPNNIAGHSAGFGGSYMALGASACLAVTEGYHTLTPLGACGGSTSGFQYALFAEIRG
jgi:hypothetical protein